MRKIILLLLILAFALGLTACNPETVTLHCDGENCENTVEVRVEGKKAPDESWVVFCQDCANNVLQD